MRLRIPQLKYARPWRWRYASRAGLEDPVREVKMAKLNINGKVHAVEVEADTPLLWVIREQVGLTGTKYGCGVAQCGACSVHINGQVQRSCSYPVSAVKPTDRIVTIEGLSKTSFAPGAESLGRARRSPVRLLPVGPDHGRRGPSESQTEAHRQGHRRSDDEHLPLRNLPAHSRRGAPGGRKEGGLK